MIAVTSTSQSCSSPRHTLRQTHDVGNAIDAIREHYRADRHREPNNNEIRDVVEFVLAQLDALVAEGNTEQMNPASYHERRSSR